MNNALSLIAFCALGSAFLSGCSEHATGPNAPIALGIDVDVASDPGHGTANVEIVSHGHPVATTDANGHATVTLHGNEGDVVELAMKCPSGFDSPAQPLSVAIRRLSTGSRLPRFAARCAPQVRTVVVGVRADKGVNLPVLYLGHEIARTDASGAAVAALTVTPGEHVSLVLDTKTARESSPRLLPESPTLTFVAKDTDDFVAFEQRFDIERTKVKASNPARGGPTRL